MTVIAPRLHSSRYSAQPDDPQARRVETEQDIIDAALQTPCGPAAAHFASMAVTMVFTVPTNAPLVVYSLLTTPTGDSGHDQVLLE